MKKLSDERLEHFNIDNVHKYVGWETIHGMISGHFQNGDFSFLDVAEGMALLRIKSWQLFHKPGEPLLKTRDINWIKTSPMPEKRWLKAP